ncbi:MAG: sensor histidine kinase [Proteobacteria bacterium]|nr:sensor histidine kinase [Pseudomonadota bacterium]
MRRFRSILGRVVALHVVAVGVISVLMPLALYWLLNEAANGLHRDSLMGQAVTVSGYLRPQANGGVAFDIPAEMRALYTGSYGLYAYAVIDPAGKVVFSSRNDGTALFPPGETHPGDWTMRRRSTGSVLFGVTVPRTIDDRTYQVQVGQDLSHRDVIIDDIVASFFPNVMWITFPLLLALLLIDILIFRRALAPVRDASTTAAAIGPTRTEVRLPEGGLPSEILPLVHAVNAALDRLEKGFRAQRDFTADMAHELRTPLTIIRARVDSLDPGPLRDALRADLENMTRVVNQVLDIAELESFVVGNARADLQAVCADAVALMAPLAVAQSKTIALGGVEHPVWVHGHAEALFRAVRNLVENAIRHTPADGSIEVEVLDGGIVRVLDDGPGVAEAERDTIFRRFWRRDRTKPESRGLGLAIVARVAETHEGRVAVENRPTGGAAFTLTLKPAETEGQSPERQP